MNGPPSRELSRPERARVRRLVTDLCANHDNQDRLCLPLDCPCYMLHKWWAGSFCRYFQEAVLPVDPALESAITGEDTSLKQKPARSVGGLTAYYQSGILFGFLTRFCQTEIRAGTQAPEQTKSGVICPQLNQKEA